VVPSGENMLDSVQILLHTSACSTRECKYMYFEGMPANSVKIYRTTLSEPFLNCRVERHELR
jgi:hypothetical protein